MKCSLSKQSEPDVRPSYGKPKATGARLFITYHMLGYMGVHTNTVVCIFMFPQEPQSTVPGHIPEPLEALRNYSSA